MVDPASALGRAIAARAILHRGDIAGGGAPSRRTVTVRFLSTPDLEALERFRGAIFAGLPDIDAYFPEDPDFAPRHLGERGVTLGAEWEGRLVACAVLGLPGPADPAFVADLPEAPEPPTATAHMASCMVDPDLRGAGLQRLLVGLRTALALAAGRPLLLARIALSNPVSLANLLACGFVTRRVLTMHSGRLRYLLTRSLAAAPAAAEEEEHWLPLDDVAGQRAALEGGWIGCGLRTSPAGGLDVRHIRAIPAAQGPMARWTDGAATA